MDTSILSTILNICISNFLPFFSSLVINLFHNQNERISQSVSRHDSYHNDCYIITVHLKYLCIYTFLFLFLHYCEFDLIESNVPLIKEAILIFVIGRNQRIPYRLMNNRMTKILIDRIYN